MRSLSAFAIAAAALAGRSETRSATASEGVITVCDTKRRGSAHFLDNCLRRNRSATIAIHERLAIWDRLRFLAFLDVASFHVTDRHVLSGFGLPTFLILTFALGARHSLAPPTYEFVRARVKRLIVPWVVWSAILGLITAFRALRHHTPLDAVFNWHMLLYGTELHLWFLPAAAVGSVLAHLLDRVTQSVRTLPVLGGCFVLSAALLAIVRDLHLAYPFWKWMFALPAVPLGLALGRVLARPAWHDPRASWTVVLISSFVMGALVLLGRGLSTPFDSDPAVRYTLAMCLLAGGALLPNVPDTWTPRLERLLLGAYLLHKPIHDIITRLEHAARVRLSPSWIVVAVVSLTLVVVAVLRRTPARVVL